MHACHTFYYGLTSASRASPLAPLIPFRTPTAGQHLIPTLRAQDDEEDVEDWRRRQLTKLGHLFARVHIGGTHVRDDHTCSEREPRSALRTGMEVDEQFLSWTRRFSGPTFGSPVMTSNPAP